MSGLVLEKTIEPSPNKKLPQKSNNGRCTSTPVAVQEYAKDALKFIDLFAGIGGIRLAFEQAGANVYSPPDGM